MIQSFFFFLLLYKITFLLTLGKRFEPLVKNFYEKITQNCVEEVGLTDHPCISYLAATPDGFVKVDKESKESILIEIKAPQFAEWDWIPVEHMAQIQLQLEVFNIKCCDYVCYFQNKSIVKVWRIYRSPVYWKWMSSRLALFWKSVCENQPPSEKEIPFIYQQATELEKNHYNYSILDSSLPRNILPPKVFYKLLTVEKWEEIQTTPPPTIDSSIFFQFIFFIFVILLSFFLLFFYS